MITVPVGSQESVTVTERSNRRVACEACGQEFVYYAVRHGRGFGENLIRDYPKTVRGMGGRHILLPRHRKMSQSPTVFG